MTNNITSAIISGASGYIGRKLAQKLVDNGVRVYSVGRTHPRIDTVRHYSTEGLSVFDGSIIAGNIVEDNMGPVDVFFDLAWEGVNGNAKNDYEIQVSNLDRLPLWLDIAEYTGAKVVWMGSASSFSHGNAVINETSKYSPVDTYGAVKAAYECFYLLRAKERGVKVATCVLGSIFGEGRVETDVLNYAVNIVKRKGCVVLNSDGNQTWNYLHVDDAVSALVAIANKGDFQGLSRYVICGDENKPLKDYVQFAVRQATGKSDAVHWGTRDGGSLTMDNSKLKNDTGWEPKINFFTSHVIVEEENASTASGVIRIDSLRTSGVCNSSHINSDNMQSIAHMTGNTVMVDVHSPSDLVVQKGEEHDPA